MKDFSESLPEDVSDTKAIVSSAIWNILYSLSQMCIPDVGKFVRYERAEDKDF